MNRRTFIKGSAATGLGLSVAGCVDAGPLSSGGSPGATDDVVLEKPERYEDKRDSRDSGGLAHPIHADRLPEATVPAPLHDRELSTREFVGDRHTLFTFIFTRCPNACQLLTDALRHVQADSLDNDYADDVALMPMTFDPENDTEEGLREHGNRHGVNREADNWFYLRPDGEQRAKEVIEDRIGIPYQYLPPEEREERGLGEEMFFQHVSAIMLANADGYVERMYTGTSSATPVNILDDFDTLRERW